MLSVAGRIATYLYFFSALNTDDFSRTQTENLEAMLLFAYIRFVFKQTTIVSDLGIWRALKTHWLTRVKSCVGIGLSLCFSTRAEKNMPYAAGERLKE